MDYFRFLKAGLAVVLVFVGVKMLIAPHGEAAESPQWFQMEISTVTSLLVVGGIISASIILSIATRRRTKDNPQSRT